MPIHNKFILSLVLSILFFSFSAFASSAKNEAPDLGMLGPSAEPSQAVSAPVKKPRKNIDRTYEQVTYIKLTKLAWAFGAHSVEDDNDLSSYVILTECKLYNKFFANEFEWDKIKKATKAYLKNNAANVPKYYEWVQPINMGRYDNSIQGFPIVTNQKDSKAKKNLQFATFPLGTTDCGQYSLESKNHASNGVITLDNPLNLSFVRVSAKLAKQYIDWRVQNGMASSEERIAYIRYRVRVDSYLGLKDFDGIVAYNFGGKLMRVDVYADPEMMLPLYNQVF